VVTDMGGANATGGTAADGADTPYFLAVEDIGGKSGANFRKREEVEWA
jgi:hypothetical protein